ncbi:integrase catalytic domain-containing protein [Trichonephila clavata]|uniref:Integrase catalytic domain-containing protein n=1 Tax=Trichonephila clavata TaxID=2740835 RepID=A0A8X6HGZ7_TRICU|nr:integrase catalytic domain-containing protein [Trichonephila clavata]
MLESLEYKVDPTSDTLLMHMILFKLDTNSRTWFERTFPTDVIPRLDELLQFLATQARSITSSFTKRNVQRKMTLVASNAQSQCPLCNGDHTLSRCLLDSGSQASLITNECIERLGLRKEKANARISCFGASDTRINGIAEVQFTPHFSSQNSFHASVYVINKIVAFYKSSPIDVLLGVDLTLPLLRGQTLSMGKDKPFAIRSELGWIIGGRQILVGKILSK